MATPESIKLYRGRELAPPKLIPAGENDPKRVLGRDAETTDYRKIAHGDPGNEVLAKPNSDPSTPPFSTLPMHNLR